MGIQKVGDTVQRDRCLAGTRATLDDHEALVGCANDAVLLGLNGGDDVAHTAVASFAQGVHERALALELQPRCVRRIQQFVLQAGHSAVTRRNMAAPNDTVRLSRRGLVEGACGRSAPVHEEGSAVLLRQGQATHVTHRAIHHVETAEDEALFHAFEAGGHFTQVRGQGLAFSPPLRISDAVRGVDAPLALAVGGPQCVQALIRAVDEVLFGQWKVGRRLIMSVRGHVSSSILWPSIVPYFCFRRFQYVGRVRTSPQAQKWFPRDEAGATRVR